MLTSTARRLRGVTQRLTGATRRSWSNEQRLHVEYRLPADGHDEFDKAVRHAVESVLGVHGAEPNPRLGRVVVAYDPTVVAAAEITAAIEAVESEWHLEDPLPVTRPEHPADIEPLVRLAVEIVGDTVGIGVAAAGRLAQRLPVPIAPDLAWAATLVDNYPQVRGPVEATIGPQATELLLTLTTSALRGMSGSVTGQVVDLVSTSVRLAEAVSRRGAWQQLEPGMHAAPMDGVMTAPDPQPRPAPLPEGPIERYSRVALPASLGAFGATLLASGDVRHAAAPLVDALPKPARLGREAFTSRAGQLLAGRGVLVMDRAAFRLADRMDHLVVEESALRRHRDHDEIDPGMLEVLAAARRAGVHLTVVGSGDGPASRVTADRHIAADPVEAVRTLQHDGAGVAAVVGAGSSLLDAADLTIGRWVRGAAPPWGAHVLCGEDPADVLAVVEALRLARTVSEQHVRLTVLGAVVGAARAVDGTTRHTVTSISRIVDGTAVLAIGDGVRMAGHLGALPESLRDDRPPWHAWEVDRVLAELASSTQGLHEEEAAARQRDEGSRRPHAGIRLLHAMGEELANPLTPVLAAGAAVSAATGSVVDAAMVGGVVSLNAAIGGTQRWRSQQAVLALQRTDPRSITTVRDGQDRRIDVSALVPGDVIRLEAGESVPADCRVVETAGAQADESALTGESLPVDKGIEPVAEDVAVGDRSSMLYEGTSLAAGEVTAVVVAVGDRTESRRALGIAIGDRPDTGVEARLEQLSRVTIPLALWSGAGVAVTSLARRVPLREVVDTAVGLAVAAVPEGLPLLATVAQQAAARRLSTHGVLVRNARAIEALGRADVVCADKTGTLTEGRLSLVAVSDGDTVVDADDGSDEGSPHHDVLLAARRSTPVKHGVVLAHPTDQAVKRGTQQLGVRRGNGGTFDVVDDLPFEPGRAYHAVLADTAEGRLIAVKGAPEVVLERCRAWRRGGDATPLDRASLAHLDAETHRMAARGLRVLAVAERPHDGDRIGDADVDGLVFRGFIGLADPPRPAAAAAATALRDAGIQLVMITGDHPSTAEGVAAALGIGEGRTMTGPELADMDDEQLVEALDDVTVFARVTPSDKVRIVRGFQQRGRVVAMTGDGANDAAAIRLADVGIAIGERATQAAREAADVVIVDDRLETIVDALVEGRALWGSVREAVAVLLGGNVGEIGYTLVGTLLGRRPPLNARQLMLVNLLTDVAPAMALAVRPPPHATPERLLREGPETSLGHDLDAAVRWRAAGTASGATVAYLLARVTGSQARASTVGLLALVGGQLGQTLVAGRADWKVAAAGVGSAAVLLGVVETPGVSGWFGSRPVGPVGLVIGATGAGVGTAVGVLGPPVWSAVSARLDQLAPSGRSPSLA